MIREVRPLSAPLYTVAAVAIGAVALIICMSMFTRSWVRVRSSDDMIRITGSAQRPIRSDFIIWQGRVTQQAVTMSQAYHDLQDSVRKVNAYLIAKGIPKSEINPAAIETTTLYAKTKTNKSDRNAPPEDESDVFRKIEGYQLAQVIEVRSRAVDLVGQVSRTSTELISNGVPFQSKPPEYLYTKLSDLKVAMLAEAARDARARADQIAASTGCHIDTVRFARMGVMQIEPLYPAGNESEISDTGANDTSSLEKKITAVVTAGFSIR